MHNLDPGLVGYSIQDPREPKEHDSPEKSEPICGFQEPPADGEFLRLFWRKASPHHEEREDEKRDVERGAYAHAVVEAYSAGEEVVEHYWVEDRAWEREG